MKSCGRAENEEIDGYEHTKKKWFKKIGKE